MSRPFTVKGDKGALGTGVRLTSVQLSGPALRALGENLRPGMLGHRTDHGSQSEPLGDHYEHIRLFQRLNAHGSDGYRGTTATPQGA